MRRYYKCVVCGHEIEEVDYLALPDTVTCPECGVSKEDYELIVE
jgi:rubredoxin